MGKVNFNSEDAPYYGIDSYWGTVRGIPDSIVMLTVTSENTVYGSIRFENESLTIKPVQNREYTLMTSSPLHIVYSEMDLLQPEEPSNICGVIPSATTLSEQPQNSAVLSPVGEYDYAYINLLIVTDNEFYNLESNWIACAMDYLSEANYQYQRPDIKIVLSASYDASLKDTFSANTNVKYHPLELPTIFYPLDTLNSTGKDVCVYLGGNDRIGDFGNATAQGLVPQPGRYTWSQMVDNVYPIQDPYDRSRHARVFCFIHELGHSPGGVS